MLIQLIHDSSHPNTDYEKQRLTDEYYTELFNYTLGCIIKDDFDPYSDGVPNVEKIISKKTNDIWGFSCDEPGRVTVKCFQKFGIVHQSIYKKDNVLRSPMELASYVSAIMKGKEILYPVENDWFQWMLSYDGYDENIGKHGKHYHLFNKDKEI